ncbi:MAG TPA: hypothetical protein VH054_27330 [Polyangiaceae bacterium]|jgi:hypothetical protein|nr:hypothetical protein [Polyangiaceae bacterium]
MSQVGLARAVGASPRSGQRWVGGQSRPRKAQLVALIQLVAPVDWPLAQKLARAAGVTPTPPPAPAPEPPAAVPAPPTPVDARVLSDAIVCAACDATDLTPQIVRRALASAVARARELSSSLDALDFAAR